MSTTFQNASMVLSIGIFFSLMIAGLAGSLPGTLQAGLTAHGVPRRRRTPSPCCPRWRCCSPPCWAATRCSRCSASHTLYPAAARRPQYLTGQRVLLPR